MHETSRQTLSVISVKKAVNAVFVLICYDIVQLLPSERCLDIRFHQRIFQSYLRNELLYLELRISMLLLSAVLSHAASAPQKSHSAEAAPVWNFSLFHKVKRANHFHTGEVLAVGFRKHSIHLPAVCHVHEYISITSLQRRSFVRNGIRST